MVNPLRYILVGIFVFELLMFLIVGFTSYYLGVNSVDCNQSNTTNQPRFEENKL